MPNENQKFPFNIIKNHDAIRTFCALAPILTGVFYAIFKFSYYWVERSYLAFWHLPKEFIHSNSNAFIYELIASSIVVSILFFLSYCFYQLKKEAINTIKIKRKYIKKCCVWSIRILFVIIIITFYTLLFHTLYYLYIKGTENLFFSYFSILLDEEYIYTLLFMAAFFGTLTLLIGFIYASPSRDKQKEESDNEKEFNYPKLYFCSLVLLVIFFAIAILFSTYNSYIEQYRSTTTFDIIENSDKVILYKDTETFVVKDAFIIDEAIYINRDSYQLIDAKDLPIKAITLAKTSSEPVFHIISNAEFQTLITESNSNEDTPS